MNRPSDSALLTGGLLLGGYALYNLFFADDARDDGLEHLDEWENPPTMTGARYAILADTLDQALFGGLGEDEDAVYRVLSELRTDGDFSELVKAFGIRSNWYTLGDATLPQALVYYLSPDELAHCNEILRGLGIAISV